MQNAAVEKLGLTIAEAAFAAGIGRSRLYEAIADGQLTARKFGARTVILRSDLNSFLDALPAMNGDAAPRKPEPKQKGSLAWAALSIFLSQHRQAPEIYDAL